MLSFPQPADSELVDGCPIVRLPDSEPDVTVFLRAIFDSSFFMAFPVRTSFDVTLRSWDQYTIPIFEDELDGDLLDKQTWDSPHEKHTSFRSFNLFEKLMLCGFFLTPSIVLQLALTNSAAILSTGVLIWVNHVQVQSTSTDILRFLSHPPDVPGCTTSAICYRARLPAIENYRDTVCDYSCRPLTIWDNESWEILDVMCPTCLASIKKTHHAARQAFWAKLPKIYGLSPWEELEKMKVDAIGTLGSGFPHKYASTWTLENLTAKIHA
ncbi:hypothetical protein C8R45DRAFT_1099103 [Mycena sanguinolenta]|nr:hypothetical protein C8R45DRAFT_1099103 [Mycena sanguinolenta]